MGTKESYLQESVSFKRILTIRGVFYYMTLSVSNSIPSFFSFSISLLVFIPSHINFMEKRTTKALERN